MGYLGNLQAGASAAAPQQWSEGQDLGGHNVLRQMRDRLPESGGGTEMRNLRDEIPPHY